MDPIKLESVKVKIVPTFEITSPTTSITENTEMVASSAATTTTTTVQFPFHIFKDLKHIYLKSLPNGQTGVLVLNSTHEEILRCPIPKLEERTAQQQCFPLNDLKGHTILNATRGLQAINFTSGNHAMALGSLKTPAVGRTFHFKTIYGVSFDIKIENYLFGDIFCCPCTISGFKILSHLDHSVQIGTIKFNSKDGLCEINLTVNNDDRTGESAADDHNNKAYTSVPTEDEVEDNTVNLSEKNTGLLVLAAVVLFEWYFRKSEVGHCGARGSLCCCGYIMFTILFITILLIIGTVLFKHWHLL